MTTLIVIAKECVPGTVKTRLHPPLSLEQAATIAQASLDDTLRALEPVPATRRILFFAGTSAPPAVRGYDIMMQPTGTLDERIAYVFDQVTGPVVLLGMDTPQVNPDALAPIFDGRQPTVDAWFGPATDGGFWCLALTKPDGALVRGVPMSRDDTGQQQLRRLHTAGLRVGLLPTMTDIDTVSDLIGVAAGIPASATSRTLRSFSLGRERVALR